MDFMYQKKNAISDNTCMSLIQLFESNPALQVKGKVGSQNLNETFKRSTEIAVNPDFFENSNWQPHLIDLMHGLSEGIQEYRKLYSFDAGPFGISGIDGIAPWRVDWAFNIQKYEPGAGYYVWHCETPNGTQPSVSRMLTWMFYLNDVDNGGTEFKFQNTTIEAEQGKLVLWPPYWTHYHRGVVNYTDNKYIVTGWCSFTNEEDI